LAPGRLYWTYAVRVPASGVPHAPRTVAPQVAADLWRERRERRREQGLGWEGGSGEEEGGEESGESEEGESGEFDSDESYESDDGIGAFPFY
jgi:hypothetical protein